MPHRFHAVQSRKAETECEQNLTPGKLKNDSDWSENGEIVVKHQMQFRVLGDQILLSARLHHILSRLVSLEGSHVPAQGWGRGDRTA